MHANNITAQAALYPGQQLVIPRFVPNQAVASHRRRAGRIGFAAGDAAGRRAIAAAYAGCAAGTPACMSSRRAKR